MNSLRRLRLEAVDGGAIQRPDLISEKMKQKKADTKTALIRALARMLRDAADVLAYVGSHERAAKALALVARADKEAKA